MIETMEAAEDLPPEHERPGAAPKRVYRHALATRIWHWTNALAVFAMIGSGLMIFNAHPRLYWGQAGANFDHAWFVLKGFPAIPSWATIPSTYNLAVARHWHLFFALVLAFALLGFMIAGLANRHFSERLRIARADLAPRHLWSDLKAHWDLRFHDPADPLAFNIFQKISYAAVIFGLLPLLVFTGLALSPGMDAAIPFLTDIFGGRQSARSLHFIAMALLVLFILVHLTLVILAGPIDEVRSMITGWWRVPEEGE